jgi:hypothetical protein
LSDLKFLSILGICEENVYSLLLEFGFHNKIVLDKEEFYEWMKKVEYDQKRIWKKVCFFKF